MNFSVKDVHEKQIDSFSKIAFQIFFYKFLIILYPNKQT